MALPAIVDEDGLAQLPEAVRSEYAQAEDGSYQLQVDPGESGLQLADVGQLQKSLQAARGDAKKARSELTKFKDIDPDKAREALDLQQKFEAGELEDDQKSRLAQAEKALSEKYEAQRQQLEKKLQAAVEEKDKREQQLMQKVRSATVDSAVQAAIAEHGAGEFSELLTPAIQKRVEMVEDDDGNFSVAIMGDDGQPMLSRRPGASTQPMTVGEYVESLKEKKAYAPLFPGSGSTGTGSTSSSPGEGRISSGGTIRLSREQSKDPQVYREAREQAAKTGAQIVFEE